MTESIRHLCPWDWEDAPSSLAQGRSHLAALLYGRTVPTGQQEDRPPRLVLRLPRKQHERLFRVVREVIDRLSIITNELENCRTAHVSNVEPDGLWRWSEEER